MSKQVNYAGFETPKDAVLSGQFELLIPREVGRQAFIRNAMFKRSDGTFSECMSFQITDEQCLEIKRCTCVVAGLRGSLIHCHTRLWPVNPFKEMQKAQR